MNHYQAYYWHAFHSDLKVAVETLGWTEKMWESDSETDTPPSEDLFWVELTPEEKAAATRLCYFRETWDAEPITSWYDYANEMHTATDATIVPDDIDLEIFRETGYAGKSPEDVGKEDHEMNNSSTSVVSASSIATGLMILICVLLGA